MLLEVKPLRVLKCFGLCLLEWQQYQPLKVSHGGYQLLLTVVFYALRLSHLWTSHSCQHVKQHGADWHLFGKKTCNNMKGRQGRANISHYKYTNEIQTVKTQAMVCCVKNVDQIVSCSTYEERIMMLNDLWSQPTIMMTMYAIREKWMKNTLCCLSFKTTCCLRKAKTNNHNNLRDTNEVVPHLRLTKSP